MSDIKGWPINEKVRVDEILKSAFLVLQLIDEATLYSKDEVIKEYKTNKHAENIEELLLNKSIYPDGEKLGFYNKSKYSLNYFLDKKEIQQEQWHIIKEKFDEEFKNEFGRIADDSEPNFKKFLKENHKEDYESYLEFERKLKNEFIRYYYGFNAEIRELFLMLLINPEISLIKELKRNMNKNTSELNIRNKIDMKNFYTSHLKNLLKINEEYINFDDLNNFLLNILFEDIEFKEKTSILHINPENYFIFSCLDHINNKNPECEVELHIITRRYFIAFSLKFLSIINKINLNFYIENSERRNRFPRYDAYFKKHKNFDFVIQTDIMDSLFKHIRGNYDLSRFDLNISSRLVYFSRYDKFSLYRYWLENDLLESLILIPYKNTLSRESNIFQLALVTVLNYNKTDERKNNFLVVDKNKNYEITSSEYSLEDYANLTISNKIYEDSYKLFSSFSNSAFSKLFSITPYWDLIKDKKRKGVIVYSDGIVEPSKEELAKELIFDINKEMYDVKMKSQKKYLEIEYFEGDNIITKNLNYPIDKLKNLIVLDKNDESDDNENYLFFLKNEENNDKFAFLDFEIGDCSSFYKFRLSSEKVSIQYLYYYLNSEIVKNEYNYFIRGHKSFRKPISEIRVPIPPKEIQDKIVETMIRRDEFLNDIKILEKTTNKNFFDYEQNIRVINEFYGKREYNKETQDLDIPDNWIYTYSGLIWPLAVTYLIASGGFSKTEKYNNLIRLFEFTVAFNSYVLMSGLPEELYKEKKSNIWEIAYADKNTKKHLKNKLPLGFGNWAFFHGTLAGIYKKEFNTKINKGFYMELLNKEIRNIYDDLADERNDYFHGSIKNEQECGTLLNQLNPTKLKIFNYLNSCYKNFRLYYVVKNPTVYSFKDGVMTFDYTMMYLNGPYSMPIYTNVLSEEILEEKTLYLQDILENKFTKIDDRLIKFEAIDENKRDWRLYVLIGFEKNNGKKRAKYRCYQRWEDDIYEDIDLNELF